MIRQKQDFVTLYFFNPFTTHLAAVEADVDAGFLANPTEEGDVFDRPVVVVFGAGFAAEVDSLDVVADSLGDDKLDDVVVGLVGVANFLAAVIGVVAFFSTRGDFLSADCISDDLGVVFGGTVDALGRGDAVALVFKVDGLVVTDGDALTGVDLGFEVGVTFVVVVGFGVADLGVVGVGLGFGSFFTTLLEATATAVIAAAAAVAARTLGTTEESSFDSISAGFSNFSCSGAEAWT